MKDILIGTTDYSGFVFIPDPASTDGSGKTGLVAANLTVSYARMETDNDAVVTDVTSSLNDLGALTTAHTDWGIKEISSTLAPGLYRIDFADAVFASGAWTAVVYVMITTSAAAASPMQFTLVSNELETALPDSVPADGSLPTPKQALYMLVQFLTERSVSGTTLTVRKVDGSTPLMTFTLSDATNPVSITRAT